MGSSGLPSPRLSTRKQGVAAVVIWEKLHYAGEVRSYTLYFPMHRRLWAHALHQRPQVAVSAVCECPKAAALREALKFKLPVERKIYIKFNTVSINK